MLYLQCFCHCFIFNSGIPIQHERSITQLCWRGAPSFIAFSLTFPLRIFCFHRRKNKNTGFADHVKTHPSNDLFIYNKSPNQPICRPFAMSNLSWLPSACFYFLPTFSIEFFLCTEYQWYRFKTKYYFIKQARSSPQLTTFTWQIKRLVYLSLLASLFCSYKVCSGSNLGPYFGTPCGRRVKTSRISPCVSVKTIANHVLL